MWLRFAAQSVAVRAFRGLAENTLSALLNHPSECPATVRARFEARRVVAENVYVSYRPRQKPCPECHELVGCRANECPGCGYDFKGAREAPAPVSLTRRGAATLGVRIKLGGRVAPGKLVASVRAESAQRRGLRAAPRAARHDEADSNAAAATRSALLSAVDELIKSREAAFFREPVDTLYVPDYLDVIAKPMDLSTLRADITSRTVTSVAQLAGRLDLIVTNATKYNPPGHTVHEAAKAFARRAAIAVDAARGRVLAKPYLPGCSKARIRCKRCRKARALPPGRTASRSTTCADLGMTCKRRECSTLVTGCSCTKYPTAPRAVVRMQRAKYPTDTKSAHVHTKYFCTCLLYTSPSPRDS